MCDKCNVAIILNRRNEVTIYNWDTSAKIAIDLCDDCAKIVKDFIKPTK